MGFGSAATLICNRENSAIIKNTIILNIIQHVFNLRETEVVMCMITADCMVVVFNATFNNISAISWRSVLLVEETGVHGEKHRPVVGH